jgi:hypothetical protein
MCTVADVAALGDGMFKLPGMYAKRVWGSLHPPFRNVAKLVTLGDLSKTVSLLVLGSNVSRPGESLLNVIASLFDCSCRHCAFSNTYRRYSLPDHFV